MTLERIWDAGGRFPGLLATYAGRRALHGLVLGLEDERFEVRMECARALVHMKSTRPDLDVPSRLIYTAVDRELSAGKVIWEGHRLQTQVRMLSGRNGWTSF